MKVMDYIWACFLIIPLVGCSGTDNKPFVAANLVGFTPDASKSALAVNMDAGEFEIVNAADKRVIHSVYSGPVISADQSTGDRVAVIDFSKFRIEGNYFIRAKNAHQYRSEIFQIGETVYDNVTQQAIQSYYYNRCGTVVSNGEPWSHGVCHIDDAVFYSNPNIRKAVIGGWHDAGDYNKFTVNTVLSSGLLLKLYEANADAFSDGQMNIPENGNGIPDLLDEVRWALEWMLKMQDKESGGIYHKVSQKKWTGEYLPENDPEVRYVFDISSTSTAGFAGVAALGARLYENWDKEFAELLRSRAELAWQFLETHPEIYPTGGFKNPPEVHGGEYGDTQDRDERLWAAIELYKTTADDSYMDYYIKLYNHMGSIYISPLSWRDFESIALTTFASADISDSYKMDQQKVREELLEFGEYLLKVSEKNNYLTLLNEGEYYWGSASVTLGYAFFLDALYEMTGSPVYRRAVENQIHYVLGRNPFNRSLVTGVGTQSVEHPYHQFSIEDKIIEPVPGMLVGGANDHLLLNNRKISNYPGKNYEDRATNYYVNEPAINFTAIFVYVIGRTSSYNKQHPETGYSYDNI